VSKELRQVRPEPLSEEAWAPFGWLPVADTDPRDGDHRLTFAWDDVHLNLIGHARSEVPETPHGLQCEMLYRHDTHTQSVMSLDVPAVIAVAPATVDFSRVADVESIRVFRLEPLEAIVLHQGTWHWGPFPVAAEAVRLLNVQGLRYPEDNRSIDLASLSFAIDVQLS
jgi:ureidoglycolate hydrolase